MSEENNEVLKQIAASLKSIDERLGLLLTQSLKERKQGNLPAEETIKELNYSQNYFSERWNEVDLFLKEIEEFGISEDEEFEEVCLNFWGISLWGDVPDGFEVSYTTLSRKLGEAGLGQNPTRRNLEIREKLAKRFKNTKHEKLANYPAIERIVKNDRPKSIKISDTVTMMMITLEFFDVIRNFKKST